MDAKLLGQLKGLLQFILESSDFGIVVTTFPDAVDVLLFESFYFLGISKSFSSKLVKFVTSCLDL